MTAEEKKRAELDAWVATEVMGWKKRACHCGQAGCDVRAGWENIDGKKVHSFQTFRPTEILEQAMEALDKWHRITTSGNWIELRHDPMTNHYRLKKYKGRYLTDIIRLKNLAYQIVKTIKEQSNGI